MEDSRGLLQGTNPYIRQDKSSELQKPALMIAGNPAKICVHPKECHSDITHSNFYYTQ
jgi:hypothetical protein